MALSDVIARLAVSLNLETASFERGSKRAQGEVKTLQGSIQKAAGAISAAFAGMVGIQAVQQLRDMTKAAIETAGGLGEQAAALGVSTDALQEYHYAATQVGISAGEMDNAFAQLSRRLGDAAIAGKGPVVDALGQIGIKLDEIRGKSAEDVIPLIADGMKGLSTDAERASVAVDLFGRSGQKLATLLAGGSAEIDKLRASAHDLGIVLSEEDIQHADEVADKLAALNFVIEAQSDKKLLENAEGLLKFEQALGDLKLALIDFAGNADTYFSQIEQGSTDLGKTLHDYLTIDIRNELIPALESLRGAIANAASAVITSVSRMVSGIAGQIASRLNAVWDGVKAKIDQVKGWFFGLYDAVIGHSYIPDMVDGIAAEMQRLDAVMVAPVTQATTKAQQAFRDMTDEIGGLLDRLFPEIRAAMDLARDTALIAKLPEALRGEANRRLINQFTTGSPYGAESTRPNFGNTSMFDIGGVDSAIDKFIELQHKAEEARVRVAKSFKDMAEDVLGSLGRLTSAIKGGGFLGILDAVIGFGLQLGSMGAFGKSIQTRLNSTVPGYAGGTNFHPGGLALVGERGPELVSLPRGSKVTPNGGLGGNVYHISGNLLTPEFMAMIQNGDIAAAQAGMSSSLAKLSYRQSRRVG